ncbi:hypothetical protein vBKpnAMK4_00494 [Klebsiella phage vB_Kpn_AM_K4]
MLCFVESDWNEEEKELNIQVFTRKFDINTGNIDLRLSTNKTVKINSGSTLVLEMGVGSNDVYIKNQRGTGVLQLTNDSNLTFRNSQVYYAMSGRGPGKSGTLPVPDLPGPLPFMA